MISYICSSRVDQELVVNIYGTKKDYSEELVVSETKERIALINGSCPLSGDDFTTNVSKYDIGSCMAYRMDDSSYQPLEEMVNNTYENSYPCVAYSISDEAKEKLRGLQE